MTEKKGQQINSAELRRNAEEQVGENSGIASPLGTAEESQRLIHELQVHQIELEMQNEELRQARDERDNLEALLRRYSDLFDFAPVGYFNLDKSGIIRSVNHTGAGFLGVARSLLTGRSLDLFISNESRPVFHYFLNKLFASEAKETCEVVFLKEGHAPLFALVEAVVSEFKDECRAVVIDISEHKVVEEAQAQLAAIVESSDDAIIAKDLNGNILTWNTGAERIFGYRANEVIGRPISLLLPLELQEEEEQILRRLLAGERIEHFETVRLTKNGKRVDVSVTVSPIVDSQGRIIGASKIAHDITERKRAEEALSEQAALLNLAHDAIIVRDTMDKVVFWNRGAEETYGWTPDETMGHVAHDILKTLFPKSLAEIAEDMAIKGRWEGELTHTRKDGQVIVVASRWAVKRDTSGREVGVLEINRDITERKRAEEALKENEERLRLLGDNLPESAVYQYVHEPDGGVRFLYFSAGMERLNGVSVEDVLCDANILHRQIPPDYIEQLVEAEARSARELSDFDMEVPMRRPDGQVRWMRLRSRPRRLPDGRVIWDGVQTDVTSRIQAEEAVHRSEERWNAAIENFGEGAIIATEAEQVIYWNPAARRLHGFISASEGIGPLTETSNTFQLWTPDGSRPLALDEWPMRRIKRGETVCHMELRLRRPDQGWEKIVSYSGAMVDLAGGERLIFLSVYDLTEQRKAEEALRESECHERERAEELAALFEAVPMPVFIARDPDCLHLTGNRLAAEILRIPQGNELSLSGPAENRPRHFKPFKDGHELTLDELPAQRAARGTSIKDFEFSLFFDDGMIRHVLGYGTPLLDNQGRPRGAVAVLVDITERKQDEEALRQQSETALRLSEQEFRSLAEAMPQIVWATRPDGWNIYFNQQWVDYTGMTMEESYGHGWNTPFHPDDKQRAWDAWQRATQHNERYSLECRLRRADGVYRWWLIRGEPMRGANGEILKWFGTCTDIEELKSAETLLHENNALLEQRVAERTAALRESERRLVGVLESMPDAFVSFDLNLHYTYVNLNAERLQAARREELLGKDVREVYSDPESNKTISLYERVMAEGTPVTATSYHAGFGIWVEVRVFSTPDGVSVFYKDVSDKVKVETALRESEERFRLFMDNNPSIVWIKDERGRHVYLNKTYEERFGVRLADWRGKSDADVWPAEIAAEFRKNDLTVLEADRSIQITEDTINPDGNRCNWLNTKFPYRDATGNRFIAGIGLDITERKRAEAYRNMGQEILLILNQFENLNEGMQQIIDLLRTTTGVEAVGIRLQQGDDYPYFSQRGFSQDFLSMENSLVTRMRDGGICMDEDGNPCLECTCGMVICEKIDPASPQSTKGGSIWTNDSYDILTLPPSEDPRSNPRNECIHHGYASVALIPIRAKGRVVGLLQLNDRRKGCFSREDIEALERIAENIGEAMLRKQAEYELKASLHEKELLLKEVHHRVKNNLQVISSLVSLQADGSKDETVREVLRDVTYRVRSMALVHEKLYQSADFARIDFAEYTRSLLGYLWRAHGAAAANVRLTLELEPLTLPIDTAVPCGLILNELAGNALKHAFRGRTEGEVTVTLQSGAEGSVFLYVRDNGVGLPDGFNWREASSLGLRLVQLLSKQLDASVEVSGGGGSRFEIALPDKPRGT